MRWLNIVINCLMQVLLQRLTGQEIGERENSSL